MDLKFIEKIILDYLANHPEKLEALISGIVDVLVRRILDSLKSAGASSAA